MSERTYDLIELRDIPRNRNFAWAMTQIAHGNAVSREAWGRLIKVVALPQRAVPGDQLPSDVHDAIGGPGPEWQITVAATLMRFDRETCTVELGWTPTQQDMAATDWHHTMAAFTAEEYAEWLGLTEEIRA